METAHARHDEKIETLEELFAEIKDTVKGLEKKAYIIMGALLLGEILLKFWK